MAAPTQNQVFAEVQDAVKFYDLVRLLGAINTFGNGTAEVTYVPLITQQATCVTAFQYGDFVNQKTGALATSRAAYASVITSGMASTFGWILRDWGAYLNVPQTASLGILAQIYLSFQANNQRISSRGFTFGTPAAGGSNAGNGVIVRYNQDGYGFVIENQTSDTKTALCVADATSGTQQWEEQFTLNGQTAPIDTLLPSGSGRATTLTGISARLSQTYLQNPSFSQFGGTTAAPTSITNWTCSPAVSNTNYTMLQGAQGTNYYRGFPGDTTPTALRLAGTTTVSLSQNLQAAFAAFNAGTPYVVQCVWRPNSSPAGTLTMSLGNGTISVNVAGGSNGTWYTLRFPCTSSWFQNWATANLTFTLSMAFTGGNTGTVDLDDVLLAPAQTFDGGWYAALGTPASGNAAQWILNDTFSFSDTEVGEGYGIIQKIMCWRGFGTYLPSMPNAPLTGGAAALSATAGSITTGTHKVAVSFLDVNGVESGFTIATGTPNADGTHKIDYTSIPTGPVSIAARNIYMTKAGTSTPYFFMQKLNDNSTTSLSGATGLNVADGSLGAQASTLVVSGIALADPS